VEKELEKEAQRGPERNQKNAEMALGERAIFRPVSPSATHEDGNWIVKGAGSADWSDCYAVSDSARFEPSIAHSHKT
jgi:hypothetical protein